MDTALLRGVSRSFYLTLRFMPAAVREPLALGYLLARASDSIADARGADLAGRIEALERLRHGDVPSDLEPLAAAQNDPREADLVRRLPGLVAAMAGSDARDDLAWVWGHILRGQLFDLTRFGPGAAPLTAHELDEYTFLVAGCVGEFWTRLCAERLPRFTSRPVDEMVALGVRYGRGLQLVNILRDRRADAALGRVYAPAERFPELAGAAEDGLSAGLEWVRGVNVGRVRFACAVPARIGRATLACLDASGAPAKVSRAEVRSILLRALPLLWSARAGEN